MGKIFFVSLFFIECCNSNLKHAANLEGSDSKYYILEKQSNNSFVITRKCGLYSFISFKDSLLEISYHLSGTFEYRILKIDSVQNQKTITCNAEYINIGHVDTTVILKLRFDKFTETTTRIIMNKTDYKEVSDTIYATKEIFLNNYKLIELECDKKAQ